MGSRVDQSGVAGMPRRMCSCSFGFCFYLSMAVYALPTWIVCVICMWGSEYRPLGMDVEIQLGGDTIINNSNNNSDSYHWALRSICFPSCRYVP